jgi:DNA-binding IclR family transcriptional regulator
MLMGALTLSGPKIRFTRRALQTMGKELLDAALRLTAALGGNADLVKRNIRNIRR